MTDALMRSEDYVKAARVLAAAMVAISHGDKWCNHPVALELARKILSQTPRGIADQERKDSRRRRGIVD